MPALARLQPSNCANPILDIFTHIGGAMVDIAVLQFQVWEKVSNPLVPVQVYPTTPGDREDVDVTDLCPTGQKLSTGHYVAPWTPPVDELIGTHEIRWFFKLTVASPEQTMKEEFEVLVEVSGITAHGYATVAEMREEGVPATVTDAWIEQRIALASRMIDRYTGRFFEPRVQTLHLDGRGGRILQLDIPIIAVEHVKVSSSDGTTTTLDASSYKVYNRHLTEGLLSPDDRANPKIELLREYETVEGEALYFDFQAFPLGSQNVEVYGTFGYTDPDGSATGKTPTLVNYACKLLVLRYLQKLYDATGGGSAPAAARPIASESTQGQSVSFESASAGGRAAMFTGDSEIDQILAAYMKPPQFGAV